MTVNYLKALFGRIVAEYGFEKHRYMYIKDYGDFLLRISLQNPPESNEYRFNAYFLIKTINSQSSVESFLTSDIFGTEKLITGDGEAESINPCDYSEKELSEIISNTLKRLLDELESGGIPLYLKNRPEIIAEIPFRAKEYLQKEGWI